ncbi:hypothetical protein SD71_16150 [Cohnella kolymensis]|uniref:SprT-like domain-containing protein n=1 Tax=Cohnella kolymensis TaxID=1590652 RepID=A0ABR5A402_9BACL|nr:hypothetical protein [Cohnella kolymensis]KIL35157.1 hypothetical protein SD71_16150 [Cohnella kolymensis]
MDATIQDLYRCANELANKHWGVDYTGKIELTNRKWTNRNGHFIARSPSTHEPIIGMSRKRNAERTEEAVKGTLLHELVHWRLYTCGIPHRDVSHEFIRECLRVGAPISKAARAQRAFEDYQAKARR